MRLLYLHGFRSSPLSHKAQIMAARVRAAQARGVQIDWHCPQLPPSPAQAFADTMQWVCAGDAAQPLAVVGSSLGGFYAALVAEHVQSRCVLLNPAVFAARDLAAHIGRIKNWHDAGDFEFTQKHVDEVRVLQTTAFTQPERYLAIISKGDEVLDWREMTARYPAAHSLLLEGSDHAISGFEAYADSVLDFCLNGSPTAR